MAAVAPIPATTVTVALSAGPEEVLLCLDGAEALVAATESWLVWGPAHTLGAVTLPAPVACRLFLRRSAPGAAPADRQSARNASLLTFGLGPLAWERIVNELIGSGLVEALEEEGATTFTRFRSVFNQLTVNNPDNLSVLASDYALGESFDQPVGTPPSAARGGQAARHAPQRGGPRQAPPPPPHPPVPSSHSPSYIACAEVKKDEEDESASSFSDRYSLCDSPPGCRLSDGCQWCGRDDCPGPDACGH